MTAQPVIRRLWCRSARRRDWVLKKALADAAMWEEVANAYAADIERLRRAHADLRAMRDHWRACTQANIADLDEHRAALRLIQHVAGFARTHDGGSRDVFGDIAAMAEEVLEGAPPLLKPGDERHV